MIDETTDATLARLLDQFGADLANDLEWALRVIDGCGIRLEKNARDANRYVEARRHLKTRRAFETARQERQP